MPWLWHCRSLPPLFFDPDSGIYYWCRTSELSSTWVGDVGDQVDVFSGTLSVLYFNAHSYYVAALLWYLIPTLLWYSNLFPIGVVWSCRRAWASCALSGVYYCVFHLVSVSLGTGGVLSGVPYVTPQGSPCFFIFEDGASANSYNQVASDGGNCRIPWC